MSNIPKTLYYTQSHEWIKKEDDYWTVGITDHAQTMLGDLVYVELPEIDTAFEAGDECAVVESVKAAADVYCPLSAEIVETNRAVVENPQLINQDPYGRGWLFRIRPHEAVLTGLLNAEEYSKTVASEAH